MNKSLLFIVFIILMLVLSSCKKQEKILVCSGINNTFTQSYELLDLNAFFENKNANISIFQETFNNTYFNEVNCFFPIEVTRTEGYSVYAVTDGGYFYVFWSQKSISAQTLNNDSYVYFSAYLNSRVDVSIFESIKPGKSSASDVMCVDPYMEVNLLLSSGIYSYSFLDKENILQIEYECNRAPCDLDDLIVKNITVIPRKNSPSKYSLILPEDLPT